MTNTSMLIAITCICLYAASCSGSLVDEHELERMKAEGASIVLEIERFNERHGGYPSKLDNLDLPHVRSGWVLNASSGGTAYTLEGGDYRRDHFVVRWHSGGTSWVVDR